MSEANTPYKLGDHVSVKQTLKRRWYQFWLPKERIVSCKYICVYTNSTKAYVDEWEWKE